MNKIVLVCALLVLGMGSAQAAAQRSSEGDMTGKWGVGAAYLPGASDGALSGTYWVMDGLAIDGFLGFGALSSSVSGYSASSKSDFLIGASGRYDLAKPTPNLHLQVIGRLTYASNSTSIPGGSSFGGSTIDLFAGAGFEGFIPAWHAVSLEINTGLHVYTDSTTLGSGSGATTGFYLGAKNSSFLPVNVALHYYF